ncbi:BON domain-containing protein [Desulfurivibrio sp. C05AmB]|uniref:BON domain-containing protein n=1 Tax=Desulfurivibrio sp. C05AmB TaxID=3374371 RepID=UPI00376ECE95
MRERKIQALCGWALVGLLAVVLSSGCAPMVFGAGVGTGYKVHRDDRTAGQQLDDTTVASRVKFRLAGERGVPARRIDVDVVEGVVHLSGFVASEEIRQRAGAIAAEVDGARQVRNNLQVGTRTWGEALADRRTGAKVKLALLEDEEVKALGLDVDVYQGVVFLNGVVADSTLKSRAGEIAAGMEGVREVRNQIMVNP